MAAMDERDRSANRPGPSWHADPLSSTPRLRWWSGEAWTASVVVAAADVAAIAWTPELAELPPPIQWGSPVLRLALAPPLHITPLAELPVPSRDPGSAEPLGEPVEVGGHHHRSCGVDDRGSA